jgi:hypothetical protein
VNAGRIQRDVRLKLSVPKRLEDGFALEFFEVLGIGGCGGARAAGGVGGENWGLSLRAV